MKRRIDHCAPPLALRNALARPASAAALAALLLIAAPTAQAAESTSVDDAFVSSSIAASASAETNEGSSGSTAQADESSSTASTESTSESATPTAASESENESSVTNDSSTTASDSSGQASEATTDEQTSTTVVTKPSSVLAEPKLISTGIVLSWSTEGTATEYRIYRKSATDSAYTAIATLTDGATHSFTDSDVTAATTYHYYVRTYYQAGTKQKSVKSSKVAATTYLATPTISTVSKKASKTTLKLSWQKVPLATTYQIDYATDRLFRTKQSISVKGSKKSLTISGLKKNQPYYVRIRAYSNGSALKLYSAYAQSQTANASATTTLTALEKTVTETTVTYTTVKKVKKKTVTKNGKTKRVTVYKTVKKNGKTKRVKVYTTTRKKHVTKTKKNILFEVRSQAGQQLYGFDTVQGGTSDGTYLYYVLYNRALEALGQPSCLIAKFKGANLKLKKLSGPLDIDHGNSLTYDTVHKRLIATHCENHLVRLSYISPKTLKVTKTLDVAAPSTATGIAQTLSSQKVLMTSYCAERKQYVAYLKETYTTAKGKQKSQYCFTVFDKNMNEVKRLLPSFVTKQTTQTVLATEDYILLGVSPKSGVEGGNQFLVYDWDGNYLTAIPVESSYELENAYFYQGQLYVTFYAATYGVAASRNNYVYLVSGL